MKPNLAAASGDHNDEIKALVLKLQETQQRLQELTGGQVDAVLGRGGQSILLQSAQEKLRESESNLRQLADMMMAILNALPAHIALLDSRGVIISVNNAWEQFAQSNELHRPKFGVNQNYLKICEQVTGEGANDAKATAQGIRQVLQGKTRQFTLEYPCHSATEKRWFNLIVTPVREDSGAGAVVMHLNITNRKEVEEALKASMQESQSLAEAMPQVVWRTGQDGLNDYFNQHWVDYTGLTLEESLGDGWIKPFHPEDRERAWKAWQYATAERGNYSIECRLRRADGQYRWWLIRGLPLKDAEGTILKWYGTCTDIHDFKLAEMEIVRINRALKMLSRCNEILVRTKNEAELLENICRVIVEVGGYRMAWVGFKQDDEAQSIKPMAYAGEEKGYFSAIKISWNEDEPLGRGPAGQVINSGQTFVCADVASCGCVDPWLVEINKRGYRGSINLPLRNKLTFGILGLYSSELLQASADEIKLLEEMANDLAFGIITLRSQAEQKRTESRFSRLVDSNVQAVIFWNTKGKIMDGNDAFLKLVGQTREDLEAGRIDWMAMTPPEYVKSDEKALQELAEKGVCEPYEKEWILKDGSRVPILIGAAMFEDEPEEGVCFVVDLTERKKLEQQFLRAQRMESIGTLAGGIAHDLNNILAPIMMSIDILKLKVTDPQASNILQTLEVSSKRGADIVRQVLSFARGIEGERIEVQPKHLVKDIETIIRDTFPKSIQQELSLPASPWTIFGDPTLLHQILLNLCVNARDAMPDGGKLTIKVENCVLDQQYVSMNTQAKAGRYVLISVSHTGMGISSENIDKIFEPFFTTKEVGKGTGLGLSTVLGVVKSHEGVVNVYSEPGKGTTFRVYLPALEAASKGLITQTKSLSYPRGNGETILVVDDEASVLTITSQTLEAFGYRVLTATDGADAVAVYAQNQDEIAVVLTDMMMPIMDGSNVIRVLTRINPEIKIIASSGLAANGSGDKPSGLNVKHFLTKPYTAGTLLKALKAILEET